MDARSNSMPVLQKMLTWKNVCCELWKIQKFCYKFQVAYILYTINPLPPWYLDTKRGIVYGNLHRKSLPQK